MSRRKKHNKMYMTSHEYKDGYGGKKVEIEKKIYRRLPFNYCALSLTPIGETAVATEDGTVFDILNIIPYVQKHHIHPITGKPLKITDLIKLKFHKNQEGQYHCPITYKVFTEHSHIVAIKTSGNVYSYDAVRTMNIELQSWKDLLDGQPFTKEDIITIQDPNKVDFKDYQKFHHLKHEKDAEQKEKEPSINEEGSTGRILEEVRARAKAREEQKKKKPAVLIKRVTTDLAAEEKKEDVKPKKTESKILYSSKPMGANTMSSSFTSTAMNIITKDTEQRSTSEEAKKRVQYHYIRKKKKKGYVTLHTNVGDLHLILHCDMAPKTCENFITHCENGYYNKTEFHRLIPGFMIQGGDPTASGRGGKSIWGKPFGDEFHPKLKHDDIGILSMANSGKNTNGSQFFITFKATPHLDNKHSVFGKVVGGIEVLKKMENVRTDPNDRPLQRIEILRTSVHANPYTEPLPEEKKKEEVNPEDQVKGQWYTNPLPELKAETQGVGKYIKLPPNYGVQKRKSTIENEPIAKKQRFNQFDFSKW